MRWQKIIFLSAGAVILSLPGNSVAQPMDPAFSQQQQFQTQQEDDYSQGEAEDPGIVKLPVNIVEPDIPPVKFIQQNPPDSLTDRVNRLIQGIKVDVPPEYDIYGYELRRYMAHIGSPDVLNDRQRRDEELKNIAKARIIHQYWRKQINKEISEIQKIIEETNASSEIRSKLKYNSGIASAFLTECLVWIDKNEAMLKFFEDKDGKYKFRNGSYLFLNSEHHDDMKAHYKAATQSREIINQYLPFRTMVY